MHTVLKWSITTEGIFKAINKKLPAIYPGEILLEEFLEPMGISQYRIARDIGVLPRRINEIVHGKRGITPDTALRLSRYFASPNSSTCDRVTTVHIHYRAGRNCVL